MVKQVSLLFGGDVLLTGAPAHHIENSGEIYDAALQQHLQAADLVFANLELPFSSSDSAELKAGGKHSPPSLMEKLSVLRLDVVSLANNHMLDAGKSGLTKTREALDKAGIRYCGAGLCEAEARRPVLIERNGCRIGVLAYAKMENVSTKRNGFGVAQLIEKDVCADVAALRPQVDLLVVSVHWGIIFNPHPLPDDERTAKAIIGAGADILVGHHPHVYQRVDSTRGSIVAYSLGNFIADLHFFEPSGGRPSMSKADSILLSASWTESGLEARLVPIVVDRNGITRLASEKEAERILETERMLRASAGNGACYGPELENQFRSDLLRMVRMIRNGNFGPVLRKLSTIRPKHFLYVLRIIQRRMVSLIKPREAR